MLDFNEQDDLLTIRLQSPETRNALSFATVEQLHQLITQSRCRGLLLTAEGRVFCSGGQLKDYAVLTEKEAGVKINRQIRRWLGEIAQTSIARVAVVDGFCFGGGVEFLGCFHQVIATPKAMFALWQRRIGLSFGWGGRALLERKSPRNSLSSGWFRVK